MAEMKRYIYIQRAYANRNTGGGENIHENGSRVAQ
jgi:hypothetical protein